MRRRVLIIFGISIAVMILLSPFVLHKLNFDYRYRSNQARWYAVSKGNHDAVVLSNSLDYPAGGENRIGVREGRLLEASNPDCETCSLAVFQLLTIEAIFERIYRECIQDNLRPICNVVNEESTGYPMRLDTYLVYEDGVHAPSITITEVKIIDG
jgi:hypothetical protein